MLHLMRRNGPAAAVPAEAARPMRMRESQRRPSRQPAAPSGPAAAGSGGTVSRSGASWRRSASRCISRGTHTGTASPGTTARTPSSRRRGPAWSTSARTTRCSRPRPRGSAISWRTARAAVRRGDHGRLRHDAVLGVADGHARPRGEPAGPPELRLPRDGRVLRGARARTGTVERPERRPRALLDAVVPARRRGGHGDPPLCHGSRRERPRARLRGRGDAAACGLPGGAGRERRGGLAAGRRRPPGRPRGLRGSGRSNPAGDGQMRLESGVSSRPLITH